MQTQNREVGTLTNLRFNSSETLLSHAVVSGKPQPYLYLPKFEIVSSRTYSLSGIQPTILICDKPIHSNNLNERLNYDGLNAARL